MTFQCHSSPLSFSLPTSSSHGFKDVNKTHASFALTRKKKEWYSQIFVSPFHFMLSFPSSFRLFLLGKTHISRKEKLGRSCHWMCFLAATAWLWGCNNSFSLLPASFFHAETKPTSISRKKRRGKWSVHCRNALVGFCVSTRRVRRYRNHPHFFAAKSYLFPLVFLCGYPG